MNKAFIVVVMLASMTALGQTLPVITSSPNNTTIYPGQTATFNVSATGATSYQWLCNGTNIPGATSATLQVSNAQSTNCGYYMALVQNSTGWIPSQLAYLSLDYTYGGSQPTACGTLPLSNTNDTYSAGDILDGYGAAPINGTVQIVAGPQLDEMNTLGEVVHYRNAPGLNRFYNGYYNAPDQSDSTALPGQAVYYSVIVHYTNDSSGIFQPSTIMQLPAGTNGAPAPSCYGLKFPSWWAGEGTDPDDPFLTAELPANELLIPGESLSLTNTYAAYADYGNPTTQWRKNGIPIPNATNNIFSAYPGELGGGQTVLTITNVQAFDAGIYDCIIYGNDWIVSPKITLSVQTTNGQGVFQTPKYSGTNFVCNLIGAAGRNYQVQWSTNLTGWNNLMTLPNLTGTVTFTNSAPSTGPQFYRTVLLPF